MSTTTRVYICTEVNMKSRIFNWWQRVRLKSAFQHLGLLVTLMVYTVMGGLVKDVKLSVQNLFKNIFKKLSSCQ